MMSWVSGIGICIYYSVNVEQTISYAIVLRRGERKLKSLLGRVRDDIVMQFRKTINGGGGVGGGGEKELSSSDGGSNSRKRRKWRRKGHGGEMMRFNYDPFSYSLNFDDGNFGFFC